MKHMSKIFIKDLVVDCIIGVGKQERLKKQSLIINVTLWSAVEKAFETDDVADTVNYKDIYLQIVELVEQSSFHLLERLAYEIAKICIKKNLVEEVLVCVEKTGRLQLAKSAGVEITMRKDGAHE